MNIVKNVKTRGGETGELIAFLWKAKLWFVIPFIVILLVFAAILFFASAAGVAPFIYTLIWMKGLIAVSTLEDQAIILPQSTFQSQVLIMGPQDMASVTKTPIGINIFLFVIILITCVVLFKIIKNKFFN